MLQGEAHGAVGHRCSTLSSRALIFKSKPVYSRRLRNAADQSQRVDIEHLHLGSMRDVQTARAFVDGEIVPTARAWDRNFLRNGVSAGLCGRGGDGTDQK